MGVLRACARFGVGGVKGHAMCGQRRAVASAEACQGGIAPAISLDLPRLDLVLTSSDRQRRNERRVRSPWDMGAQRAPGRVVHIYT
jgi:hypothetical protein